MNNKNHQPNTTPGNHQILDDLHHDLEHAWEEYQNLLHWGIHTKLGNPCLPLFNRLTALIELAGAFALQLHASLNNQDWQAAIQAEQQAHDHLAQFHDRRQHIIAITTIAWNAVTQRREAAANTKAAPRSSGPGGALPNQSTRPKRGNNEEQK